MKIDDLNDDVRVVVGFINFFLALAKARRGDPVYLEALEPLEAINKKENSLPPAVQSDFGVGMSIGQVKECFPDYWYNPPLIIKV